MPTKYYSNSGAEIHGSTETERTEWYNFLDYSPEIKKDGYMDVSEYLTSCLAEHDNVFIPAGKYNIESSVILRSGNAIKGEARTLFSTTDKNLFVAHGVYDAETGTLDRVNNISISNLTFHTDLGVRCFVFDGTEVENVSIRNVKSLGAGTAYIHSSLGGMLWNIPYAKKERWLPFVNTNITIADCKADGIDRRSIDWGIGYHASHVGIHLDYVADFIIENCEVCDFSHGIQFFGGISHPNGGMKYSNEPYKYFEENRSYLAKTTEGIITHCNVHDIKGGGMWGTNTRYLTICDNDVVNCDDGCIDFECCRDCICTRNNFINGLVGGPGAYEGTIIYSYNHFEITEDWWRSYYFIKGSPDTNVGWPEQNIIFDHNEFVTAGRIGTVNATMFEEPAVGHFTFTNNKCVNTVVNSVSIKVYKPAKDNSETLDIWDYTVKDNTFRFDGNLTDVQTTYPAAIYAQVGTDKVIQMPDGTMLRKDGPDLSQMVITGNKVECTGSEPIVGIYITNSATKDGCNVLCADNELINSTLIVENINANPEFRVDLKNNTATEVIVK